MEKSNPENLIFSVQKTNHQVILCIKTNLVTSTTRIIFKIYLETKNLVKLITFRISKIYFWRLRNRIPPGTK